MAGVGFLACRKSKAESMLSTAKPRPAPKADKRPPFPCLKLLEGGANSVRNPAKTRVLKKDENVIFVSFSSGAPDREAPSAPTRNPRSKKHPGKQFIQNAYHKTHWRGDGQQKLVSSSKPLPQEQQGTQLLPQGVEMKSAMVSSGSSQKGLQNLKRGKFDPGWMVKWLDWYKFVVAMTRKIWDVSSSTRPGSLSSVVRAESAKTAWSG